MDITIVSLLPWALEEIKPGLIPDTYYVPAAKNNKPAVLHIKDGASNLYVRDGKTYPITHPAEEIANSIVNDYCSAQLQYGEDSKPAIFWVPGKLSIDEVLLNCKDKLAEAKKYQNNWFMKLIRLADDDWTKTGQHRMITDLQRHAATSLGLLNKPWMQSVEAIELVKCPACSTLVDSTAALCYNCKHITNKEKAKELGIGKVA